MLKSMELPSLRRPVVNRENNSTTIRSRVRRGSRSLNLVFKSMLVELKGPEVKCV